MQPSQLGAGAPDDPMARAAHPAHQRPAPLERASRAWLAMKVSPVLESLAFLARGVESGRPPRGAACPVHVLGPLIGTVIGPAGGRLPWDAVEELFQRASDGRGVTLAEWSDWRRHRFSPFLLQDVTMLAYRGSCVGRSDEVRCRCESAAGDGGPPVFSAHRTHPGLGPVPALTPDPTGRTDPWQEALVELAARFRGRGSPHASKFSGSGPPTVLDIRTLVGNLDRLAGAFAGPRRADRMGGLERLDWNPPLPLTAAWGVRDRAGGTDDGRAELLARLLHAVGA